MEKNKLVSITIISKSLILEGEIESMSDIRIEGEIRGPIVTTGKVIIDKSGIVRGDVSCESLELHGVLIGNVIVDQSIILGESSEMKGDVECDAIDIRKGAKFFGFLKSHIEKTNKVKSDLSLRSIGLDLGNKLLMSRNENIPDNLKSIEKKQKNNTGESKNLTNGAW